MEFPSPMDLVVGEKKKGLLGQVNGRYKGVGNKK